MDKTDRTTVSRQDRSPIESELDENFCPVCGVELSLSNFLTPEHEYYCPCCVTRQTPALL